MEQLLIHNGTLLDGSGRAPLPGAAVLLEGNRILAAGPEAQVRAMTAQNGARSLDAQGGWLLPGFIDAHVHLMSDMSAGYNLEKELLTPFSRRFYQAAAHFKATLEAGITGVRDAGGLDRGVKQALDEGLVLGPRVQPCINMLSISGGHADGWLPSGVDLEAFVPYPGMPSGRCDGPSEVRRKVREMVRAGAEVIKIMATGGVLSPYTNPQASEFSPEELRVIVDEAEARGGLRVMAHAQGPRGIKNAVRAGIHSIEHGNYLDDEAAELMLQHGTFLVPTLLAPHAILAAAQDGQAQYPPQVLAKARSAYAAHSASFRRAYQAGVKIAMGTDAAVMKHGTNLRELRLMCENGMTPLEAIVVSTLRAAECLGWDDRLGSLEPGKLADLVIWRADPLADLRLLEDPANAAVVIKDGKVVKSDGRAGAAKDA
jgi:imidazolonepropionase-like amidohydrolase